MYVPNVGIQHSFKGWEKKGRDLGSRVKNRNEMKRKHLYNSREIDHKQ